MGELENKLCVSIYDLAREAHAAGKEGAYEAYMICLNRIENYFMERKAAKSKEKKQLDALIRLLDRASECSEDL